MGIIKDVAVGTVKHVVKKEVTYAAVDAAVKATEGLTKAAVVVGVATATVGSAIDKTVNATIGDKETRHNRKEQRYLSSKKESNCLIIQKVNQKKELFSICDIDGNVKYYVSGKLSSDPQKVNLILLDKKRCKVASVKKKAFSVRMPLFHERTPADYAIEIGGENVAVLKTKPSKHLEDYEIVPYGWVVKGSVLKWDFRILDGDFERVHISQRSGYSTPTYIIDFPDDQYELIGLMIVLTLICRE